MLADDDGMVQKHTSQLVNKTDGILIQTELGLKSAQQSYFHEYRKLKEISLDGFAFAVSQQCPARA
jgi:hypothetical protein